MYIHITKFLNVAFSQILTKNFQRWKNNFLHLFSYEQYFYFNTKFTGPIVYTLTNVILVINKWHFSQTKIQGRVHISMHNGLHILWFGIIICTYVYTCTYLAMHTYEQHVTYVPVLTSGYLNSHNYVLYLLLCMYVQCNVIHILHVRMHITYTKLHMH